MPNDNNVEKIALNHTQEQSMALAALVQAAELVRQLAYTGSANAFQVRPLLHSLFEFNPHQSADVYADLRLLEQGFNRLHHLLNGQQLSAIDKEIIRYAVVLLNLADRLLKRGDYLTRIENGLSKLDYPSDDAWLALPHSIAGLYTDTISQLGQRIQVAGDANHLNNDLTAARIRTLLFSGVRAAILWRQLKGSKLSLFFQRGKYKRAIKSLSPINQPNDT